MATVIETRYVDDLDGLAVERDELQLISWSWRGVHFALETSRANLELIENGTVGFATVLAHSKRQRGRKIPAALFGPPGVPDTHSMMVRRWARQNGHTVSTRGRISTVVLAAFAASH